MKTIFVQIASYRDAECQWTVKDLLTKAKHPERVHVGICWQYDPKEDVDCFQTSEWPDQVKFNPFHWKESEGICWARHQAQQLWDGEDYILSIDSHMRFAPAWDTLLIEQLEECPSPKAVLSNLPAGYTPPDNLQANAIPTVLRAHFYSPQGDLRIYGAQLDRAPQKPLKGAFCLGGFMFAKSDLIRDVPADPYLYFDQEDIALSARLYTHGYDVYSPSAIALYRYDIQAAGPNAKLPPRHSDDSTTWLRLQERGRKRLNHLLGTIPSTNAIITQDVEKYALGSARTLAEYKAFCGIDFAHRTVSDRALRCGFIEKLSDYRDAPIRIPEIDDAAMAGAAAIPVVTQKPAKTQAFDQPLAIERVIRETPNGHKLNIDKEAPEGLLIIYDYIDTKTCKMLKKYADSQTFTHLDVVDPDQSTKDKIVSTRHEGRITHHVEIDGKAPEILSIFNDIYCHRMAAFYNVNFEWYERPQILRYPPGGKYDRHTDAEHWTPETNEWKRVQDRDYSVLLYLNDEYEGGELELVNQNFTIKPKPGMLLAFPSDNRYLHAALPTTSGIRYVIVSWAAIIGSQRVLAHMPYASIYVRQKRDV